MAHAGREPARISRPRASKSLARDVHVHQEPMANDAAASVAGPGVLAAVIEVLRVFALQRLDLALDEGVELAEVALDLGRNGDAASTGLSS
jgi:hypothetical protein